MEDFVEMRMTIDIESTKFYTDAATARVSYRGR